MPPLTDEMRYKLLRILEADPNISQRDLAKALNISLGKANYCMKALMEKGLVKAKNFRNNRNKVVYTYLLTPKGIEEKARVTIRFLRIKLDEHKNLLSEISDLRREVKKNNQSAPVK